MAHHTLTIKFWVWGPTLHGPWALMGEALGPRALSETATEYSYVCPLHLQVWAQVAPKTINLILPVTEAELLWKSFGPPEHYQVSLKKNTSVLREQLITADKVLAFLLRLTYDYYWPPHIVLQIQQEHWARSKLWVLQMYTNLKMN